MADRWNLEWNGIVRVLYLVFHRWQNGWHCPRRRFNC